MFSVLMKSHSDFYHNVSESVYIKSFPLSRCKQKECVTGLIIISYKCLYVYYITPSVVDFNQCEHFLETQNWLICFVLFYVCQGFFFYCSILLSYSKINFLLTFPLFIYVHFNHNYYICTPFKNIYTESGHISLSIRAINIFMMQAYKQGYSVTFLHQSQTCECQILQPNQKSY